MTGAGRDGYDDLARHYGARAAAYVASPVHAMGADLDRIAALMAGRAPARALDLGCGGGHVSLRAAPHAGEVTACDVTPEMLAALRAAADARGIRNLRTVEARAEALPFPDGWFDAVLCRFSAHHWLDLAAGLREARRVLAADGVAVLIDTVAPEEAASDSHLQAVELLRDPSHARNRTESEWRFLLRRAGFAIEATERWTLRMEFDPWCDRTATPPLRREAIRALQDGAPDAVRRRLAIGADGGFDLDVVGLVLRPVVPVAASGRDTGTHRAPARAPVVQEGARPAADPASRGAGVPRIVGQSE